MCARRAAPCLLSLTAEAEAGAGPAAGREAVLAVQDVLSGSSSSWG